MTRNVPRRRVFELQMEHLRNAAWPRTRRIAVLVAALAGVALALGLLPATRAAAAGAGAVTVTGTLRDGGHRPLDGMAIEALPAGAGACATATGCVSTYSTAGGAFMLPGLNPGSYEIDVIDGLQTVMVRPLTVTATAITTPLTLTLGPPSVPAGTHATFARRALSWLNATRRRAGVGAGVVLNPRWSTECAAHDNYETLNATLTPGEDPANPGYSPGGAWAGLGADLAQGSWTAGASPWRDAPVSLLALLAPSLSVTGIDDSTAGQCVITFPGMLRPPPAVDTLHTVPAAGARRVPRSELARESPYTPVQFIGLPASHTTGPELFVYLNRVGVMGQAPVTVTEATLSGGGHAVAVRWVDASTPTLGPDLVGAILIPPAPLAPHTTYRASVTVRDGAGALSRAWSFTTA
jgi:hypothetical protein